MDKTGAKKLTDRFPKKISFRDVEGVGHNIPFNKALCQQIFGEIIWSYVLLLNFLIYLSNWNLSNTWADFDELW